MSEKEKAVMKSIATMTAALPPGTDEIATLVGNALEMGKRIGRAQAIAEREETDPDHPPEKKAG